MAPDQEVSHSFPELSEPSASFLHSKRNDSTGSTRVARRAGGKQAAAVYSYFVQSGQIQWRCAHQEAHSPVSYSHTQQSPNQGEQNTFRQHLADELAAAGSQGNPDFSGSLYV